MTTEITENNLAKYFAQRNGDNGIDAFKGIFAKREDQYLNWPSRVASFTMGNPYELFGDFEDEPGNPLTRTCGICTFEYLAPTLNAFYFTNDTIAGETITVSFTITMTRG
jgi:hypothetical protein